MWSLGTFWALDPGLQEWPEASPQPCLLKSPLSPATQYKPLPSSGPVFLSQRGSQNQESVSTVLFCPEGNWWLNLLLPGLVIPHDSSKAKHGSLPEHGCPQMSFYPFPPIPSHFCKFSRPDCTTHSSPQRLPSSQNALARHGSESEVGALAPALGLGPCIWAALWAGSRAGP